MALALLLTPDSKIVFANIVDGMRTIIDTMDEEGMHVAQENRQLISMVDIDYPINTGEAFPMQYCQGLKRLWNDPEVQECYSRAYEFALQENMP